MPPTATAAAAAATTTTAALNEMTIRTRFSTFFATEVERGTKSDRRICVRWADKSGERFGAHVRAFHSARIIIVLLLRPAGKTNLSRARTVGAACQGRRTSGGCAVRVLFFGSWR
jgi:hypothetical protein